MVVGEDFWLRIPMNNESAGRHLCMDDVEVIHAWLESGYGGCWTLPLETDGEQLEGVAVKVPGSRLGLGTYAVVMAGKFVNGGHFRTKRQLFIRLVDREEQADAKPTMFNEEKAYWAGPAVLSGMLSRDGLNTYELAVLHGYDGTLEQFLAQAGIELQDFMVTKAKLSREVQTQLDKGEEKGITPMGAYSSIVKYRVNDMVYDATTNSSYISLFSENRGHAVTDTNWWKKTFDGNYVLNAIMTAAQQTLNEAKAATEQATAEAIAATEDATSATEEAIAAKNAANAVAAQKVAQAQIGYYECNSLATDATKVTTSGTVGTDSYVITENGGQMKIRMNKANSVDSNVKLQIGNTTALPLYYNGLPASSANSWEEGEVISVYYYNNKYWASNAQGGGGKAEKIKYDNSQSWLLVDNVQSAIDKMQDNINSQGELFRIALTNSNNQYYLGGVLGSQEWKTKTNSYVNTFYAVRGGHFYKLVANNDNVITYAFVKSLPTAAGAVDFADGGKNISYHIPAGEERIFQVPDDCVFLTFLSLAYKPSALYELVDKPLYRLINDGAVVSGSDGVILCTKDIVPPGSRLIYDFSINGGTSTSLSCYIKIYKNDGTSEYIGKTSSTSGNVDYANSYILPDNYTKLTIEGMGGITIVKIGATQLNLQNINDGASAELGNKLVGTLFSEPKQVSHGTVLFTSDQYKENDCVHIDLTAFDEISGFVSLYDLNGNTLGSFGKLSRQFTDNNYHFDVVIPKGFAYAQVNATKLVNNNAVGQYLVINSLYKVPYEHGVFKIGNPIFETLGTFNNKNENTINVENVFNIADGLSIKRIPSVIITNAGTVLSVAQNKPTVGDDSPSGLILGRKANGGEWIIDTSTFPYDSSIGSLMNPSFVIDRTGVHGVQGRIYLFAIAVTVTQSNGGFAYKCTTNEIAEVYSYSDDDGVTWSSFATIPKTAWDTDSYTWMCNSPSNGIITTDGTIALACMGRVGGANGVWVSGVMYKPVNGEWQFSQVSPRQADNESVVFEGIDGAIYLNCRNETFNYVRSLYKLNITDGSLSIVDNGFNPNVKLQCCIIKCTINSNTCYLMTFPDPTAANQRNRITVWASADGIRWTRVLRMTGNTVTAGYTMISCYNGKCVMVWENDGWDCRTIGYADLTPALELLKQSSLMCGDTPDDRIHRVACYEKGISV